MNNNNNEISKCFSCNEIKLKKDDDNFIKCEKCLFELCIQCYLRLVFVNIINNKIILDKEKSISIICPSCLDGTEITREKQQLTKEIIKKENNEKNKCILHNIQADNYCLQCQKWICQVCESQFHHKIFFEHCYSNCQQTINKCYYHITKKADVFCTDCGLNICYNCYDNKHFLHHCYNAKEVKELLLLKKKVASSSFGYKTINDVMNYLTQIENELIKEIQFDSGKQNFMLIKALFSIYYFDLFSLNSNVLTISFFINLFRITLENEIDNYKISIETINLSLPNECILMPHSIYTPSKSFKIIKRKQGHKHFITHIVQLRNGMIASVANGRKTIKIWEGDSHKTLKGHDKNIRVLLALQDGKLISSSEDCTLKIWNIEKMKCDYTFTHKSSHITTCILQLNDGTLIFDSADNSIGNYSLDFQKIGKRRKIHSKEILSIIQLQNNQIASCSKDDTIKIWELEEKITIKTISRQDLVSILQLSNGNFIISTSSCLEIIDLNTGTTYLSLKANEPRNLQELIDGRIAFLVMESKIYQKAEYVHDDIAEKIGLCKKTDSLNDSKQIIVNKYSSIIILDITNNNREMFMLTDNNKVFSSFTQINNGMIITCGYKSYSIWK